MKGRYLGLAFLTLALVLTDYKESKSNQQRAPISSEGQKIDSPYEGEAEGLSSLVSAKYNEVEFYNSKDTKYAIAAIDDFENYYCQVPTGDYAVISLLKKAELDHAIGRNDDARSELNRLKERADLDLSGYKKEIRQVKKLIR